jgi:hypothetical protein
MLFISLDRIREYRTNTFSLAPQNRVSTKEQAIAFVNQRGFVFFWPISGIVLPSLWASVAGDRPVPDVHDDPGHVTWGWKDELLGKRVWYYAKVLRKRSTIIALDVLPYFYALSENYGSPEEDYQTLYEQGRLTQESKAVYESLLKEGPLDTISLRRATHLTSVDSDTRFNRALTDLQADFKILPVGVTQAGRWNYAFSYDIVTRHFPDIIDRTRLIGERQAYRKLTEIYLRSVGAAELRDITKLFSWIQKDAQRALEELIQAGVLAGPAEMIDQQGKWFALKELVGSTPESIG